MKKIIILAIVGLFTFSCENKDISPACYHGKIIMSSCCTGSTFISIKSPVPIGKNTNLNGQEYANVIQVPGYLTGSAGGDVFLNLRKFDPDKDYILYPPIICECFVAVGMDVPVYVATSVSTTSCPDVGTVH